ncbi:MAG: hypothetical protein J6V80_02740 [Clostridia bacterium]|nr:hypothetical protein [Clostridia bacterium]
MFNGKKGRIMRHPYATLTLIGLAAVGAVSIGDKVKSFVMGKACCIGNMMHSLRKNSDITNHSA